MNTTLRFMGKFENIVRAVIGSRGFERGRARVLSAAPQWLMHQAAWWFCVLGPKGWGLLPMVAFLWTHLASNRSRLLTESTLVTAAVLIGFSVDWILLHGGWVAYDGALTVASVPLWMLALWAGFGATLTHSQKLFVSSPTRGFLVGSFGGPAAYAGGERLGRMVINGPEGLVAIGVTWALALGALALLVSKVELSSPQSSSDGTGELVDQLEPASKERLKTFA